MTIRIPDSYMGKPIKGSIERVLAGVPPSPPVPPNPAPFVHTPSTNLNDPENYIILPGNQHRNYSYPDLIVAKYRLFADSSVLSTAQSVGLTVQHTARERNGREYIGNINWTDAIKLNLALDNFTLNIRQFIDFKELLEAGVKGSKKVYDKRKRNGCK